MIKLYYSPGSCALASHIALLDAGAAHEAIASASRMRNRRSRLILRSIPKARVPLARHRQGHLTETPAILAFIARPIGQEARAAE